MREHDLYVLKRTLKRMIDFGVDHEYEKSFDEHPFSIPMYNYKSMEYGSENDYQFMLQLYADLSRAIEILLEQNKVKGNKAAEYWCIQLKERLLNLADFTQLDLKDILQFYEPVMPK